MISDEEQAAVTDFLTKRRFTLHAFGEVYRDCIIVPERYEAEPQLALQVYHWAEGEPGEAGYLEPFGRLPPRAAGPRLRLGQVLVRKRRVDPASPRRLPGRLRGDRPLGSGGLRHSRGVADQAARALAPCNPGSAKTMPATGVAKPRPITYSMDSIGARSALE